MGGVNLSDWTPWTLAAHLIAVSIPLAGALWASGAYTAMIARLHDDDPDNPILEPSPWGTGLLRRQKARLIWRYMTTYGRDANTTAYGGGLVAFVAGMFLFPQIDALLILLFSAAVQMLSALSA